MTPFRSSMVLFVALLFAVNFNKISASAIEGNEVEKTEGAEDAVAVDGTTPHSVTPSESVANRQRIIDHIFTENKYDKRNYPSNGSLALGISLNTFRVDQERNAIEANVWLRMMWKDSRITWNPEEYGGEKAVRFPSSEVWKPDVTLYNTAQGDELLRCADTNTILYPNGNVLQVPSCHVKANCKLTLDQHPYADQTCIFRFGSWTFDGYTQDVQFFKNETKADMTYFSDLSPWEITGNVAKRTEKFYDCCAEPYITLDFELTFHRKSVHPRTSCQAASHE